MTEAQTKVTRSFVGKWSHARAKTVTVLVELVVPSTSCTARLWPSRASTDAHDENNEFKIGDVAEICESRPRPRPRAGS